MATQKKAAVRRGKYAVRSDGRKSGKVWDGTYTASGKKHYLVVYGKNDREIDRKKDEIRLAVKAGNFVDNDTTTIKDYATRWATVFKSSKSANTYRMYQWIINSHLDFVGNLPFSALNRMTLQSLINANADHPRTCQQLIMTLRQICRSAEKDRLIPRGSTIDFFDDLTVPKYSPGEKRALTAQEKDILKGQMAELPDRERCFVSLIYYLGLRREEALAATIFCISFERHVFSVTQALALTDKESIIKEPKSKNGSRRIPMPKPLEDFLRGYIRRIPGPYLITKHDGGIMTKSAYTKMWNKIRNQLTAAYISSTCDEKAPSLPCLIDWQTVGFKDLTAHIFRHNYCTLLCYQKINGKELSVKKIAELLGDTEQMVIDIYSHIIEDKEDVSTAIEDALAL